MTDNFIKKNIFFAQTVRASFELFKKGRESPPKVAGPCTLQKWPRQNTDGPTADMIQLS